ncbi:MAG: glutathione peroxidase [Limisphaerales bacterium]
MKSVVRLLSLLASVTTLLAANSLQSIPIHDIDGKDTSLKAFDGKVVLLVNVASQCGYTPQYKGLEALYRKFKDKGLVVVGVPCNDFGAQEPGSASDIKEFCSTKYQVTFPLLEKIHVKGPEQHALYAALTGPKAEFPGDVKWNFGKFLIGRDGSVLKRFDSGVAPDSADLTSAIETALAKK